MIGDEDYITPKPGVLIKQEGSFDFSKLYKQSISWFDSKKYDFSEKEHTEKDKPQGREVILNWVFEREIDDYVKFEIGISMLVTDYKNKEGKIKINIKAFLELDHKHEWDKKPFGKFLKFVYNNFILKNKIRKVHEAKLYDEFTEYSNLIKSTLGLI